MKYIIIFLFMGLVTTGYAQSISNDGGKGKLTSPASQNSVTQVKGTPAGRTSNTTQQGSIKGTNTTGETKERSTTGSNNGNGAINSTTGQKRVERSPKTSEK